MLIHGEWYPCEDGVRRPVVGGEILAASGDWISLHFLIDTGADRTVLSNEVRRLLEYSADAESDLGGVGGFANASLLRNTIRLSRSDGAKVALNGEFAAFLQDEALDMSVLGRDITKYFALIVDRPGDEVLMAGQRHRYRVEEISA